ncbi:MAG TPA: gliding motility-associated C-terminal domain-containing protein [Bacteroidia bacterium]|jgi:gliding motility-associated-like protein
MKKKILTLFAISCAAIQAHSQTVDASPETQTICAGGTANLTATVTPGGAGTGSLPTDSYAISTIPYAPDAYGAGTPVSLGDDTQSGPFPIGFDFCFFGTTYTSFYVGSNGWVAFTSQPTTYTSATIPSTAAAVPKNCIMGPWQDWYPGLAANCVRYQMLGVAPFRRMVVSWNNCPMYSCTSTLGTFQIIIYETTNVIENFIQSKPNCMAWAGGTAVQGLHNAAGTVAFTTAGRNSTAWTATNEGWRYTPNGVAAYLINWYILPANTLIGTGPSITVAPPTSPQYYYVSVNCTNCCGAGAGGSNTDTVVVFSNTASVDAGAYTPICSGQSTTLNATSPSATSYSWSPAGSLSNSAISNPVATPGSTTTYTVSIVDAFGCPGADTVTIAVVNPASTAGPSVAICNGLSTTLNANGGGTYSWSPAAGLSDPTIANPVASPTATTLYTVTVSSAALGCTSTSSVTVTVNSLPVVDAGAASAMCTGSTTVLNATGAAGYVWSPAGSLSSSTVANPTSSATATTTYTVVGTDGNGCTATDNVVLTVNPLPIVDAGTNTSICPGASTTLNATGSVNYVWSPASSLDNSAVSNPVATPSSTTTYTVIGTDGNGCTASDMILVDVSGIVVTASSASPAICIGGNTTLSAAGGTTYSWTPAISLSDDSIANPIASPVSTTTYTVVGTGSGCTNTALITVTVNSLPPVDAGSTASICSGTTTTLGASGASSYVWSPAGTLSSATMANPTSSTTASTVYTVTGTDLNGCSSSDTVSVIVLSLPLANAGTAAAICNGTSTTLNASGGTGYSWTPSGSLSSSTISNPVATPSVSTTYTVTVTDSNGCTATSSVAITVNAVPTATAGSDVVICNGTSTILNSGGGGTYLWSPATGLSSATVANPTASPASTQFYTVTVSNGSCSDTAGILVTVNNALAMASPTTSTATCGNSDGSITAGTITGGSAPFMYSLNSGGLQSSSTFSGIPSGSYTLTATDAAGCSTTQTGVVNSVLGVNAAFSGTPTSGSSPLTVDLTNSSNGASGYVWSFGDGTSSTFTNPSVTYTQNGSYTILLIAYNGSFVCSDTAFINIEVFDQAIIIAPNVFTPNGDGNNDMFILNSIGLQSVEGVMFNRWGKKIAEWSGSPSTGWDGKINGSLAEDGTYYYIIKAKGLDKKDYEEKGFVQLLAN